MAGIDRHTGKSIDGLAHVRQSIIDILTTPIGSRVMCRDYGSRLFSLVDSGVNHSGVMDVYHAVVTALAIWEPRLSVTNVMVTPSQGKIVIDLAGVYRPNGQSLTMRGIEVSPS